MMALLLFLLAIALFDLAALRWGVDSTDDINSREWDRRSGHGYWLV